MCLSIGSIAGRDRSRIHRQLLCVVCDLSHGENSHEEEAVVRVRLKQRRPYSARAKLVGNPLRKIFPNQYVLALALKAMPFPKRIDQTTHYTTDSWLNHYKKAL